PPGLFDGEPGLLHHAGCGHIRAGRDHRRHRTETTALGAAYLAGLAVGIYPSLEALRDVWRCERRFEPKMTTDARDRLYAGWRDAIRRSRGSVQKSSG
ncbi:MAG: hypothetical protein AAF637_16275, partial [Pseudomonadota bacterium]